MDGHALGGGCILALMFDSRVMQYGARIGMNEAEFGLAAPNWAMSLLRSTVGQRAAEKALSTGTVFDSG
jgi:enoyl-CoA hydratase/carnithine racemase